ncbi:CapA family protein [Archangium sp.]|uniref:CapA family protein n=1 Tax=Archangium sp. TaxID=1872627 RepID=UPI002D33B7E3|nr:CapA family protein [Archangium sp.]HYO56398.1 CapA family protein [Archangium sp.]
MRSRSLVLSVLAFSALGGCATARAPVVAESESFSRSESSDEGSAGSAPASAPAASDPHPNPLPEGEGAAEGADSLYARGVEALEAKDAPAAIASFSACTRVAPSRIDCHWELGWAYSLLNRWSDALTEWTAVQKLDPNHPDLEDALTQARGQSSLQQKLATGDSAKPSPRSAPPKDARVRIRAVGDVMLGTDFPEGLMPPDDGASSLSAVYPLLRDADLTFVNLEGPLCDNGETKKCRKGGNCYAFRTPTRYGKYFQEAGVDIASTANNHSGDFGELCRRETEATLDSLGIAWSGPAGSVATVERNGLRIGMVAFHTSASCNHLNNTATAAALVRQVRQNHDLVLVSFHGGAEGSKALNIPKGREMFFGEDRGDLRLFTHAVIDAGADLVLGHGPHVVRAMEFYKDRLIVYSMGNFATYGSFNLKGPQGLGMVVDVELDSQGRFRSGRILPTRQEGKGIPVPDASGEVIPLVRRLTGEDFPDTGAVIGSEGTISPRKGPIATGAE